MEFLFAAFPAIISTATLGVVSFFGVKIGKFIKNFQAQHDALCESQRNQLKASIVATYERAVMRGYITPLELDTVNREYDSYVALGGNHYIHSLIKRLNEMPCIGEPIPEE